MVGRLPPELGSQLQARKHLLPMDSIACLHEELQRDVMVLGTI